LALASAREQIISEVREPTLGEVVQQAMQARRDLPEVAFQQVATEILAAQPEQGAKVGEAIRQEIARRIRIHPEVKKAMEEAFAVVLEEFRDTTLRESVVLESVGRQVHGISGGQMREFARRLRDAAPKPLTEVQILEWADAHFDRKGKWPTKASGLIDQGGGENWQNVENALRIGLRGLPGGSSLAQLLAKDRGVRNIKDLPPLTVVQILAWADAHHQRMGVWPGKDSGLIPDAPGETWVNVDAALRAGLRGLLGNSSLSQLLAEHRGVRNPSALPQFTKDQVLAWADAHFERTGYWPNKDTGRILEAPSETWVAVNYALKQGNRGFPGGSSLTQILASERGVRNSAALPPLTKDQILAWADAHFERTGKWPKIDTGPVVGAPDETWTNVHAALSQGQRGLPGGSSLAQLLAKERGVRNQAALPPLTEDQILAWADAYHARTGQWPNTTLGSISDALDETWVSINNALSNGSRGLPGGSSLAKLLAEERGVRNRSALSPLTKDQILAWADMHFRRTGRWPKAESGSVEDAPGEKWMSVENALRLGLRGLSGGSSLARLIKEHRSNSST
jgi:hypothetical protein